MMNSADEELSPPARLAVAYAPKAIRAAFALLLRFDMRFASIVGQAGEPLIAQMKLAWWRDAIRAEASQRPKGEPLLSSLLELDGPVLRDSAVQLANAWELLLGDDDWSGGLLATFATNRGEAIFLGYAKLARRPAPAMLLAEIWAANDLGLRFGERAKLPSLTVPAILPKDRIFRPLTILAMSVRGISGPRLIWHALTGR